MTNTCRALDRYVDQAPSVFRLRIPVSQAEMNQLRPHFLPDESATHAILRLALERAQGVA